MIPLANAVAFTRVPMAPLVEEGEKGLSLKELFSTKVFWIFLLMMTCAGASEQAVSQWASTLAEKGLGVSKTVGDLAGPMAFAILMGASRAFYGKYGEKIDLDRFMKLSCILCMISYLSIALISIPAVALLGCALCGMSVGIMWPGTFSKSAAVLRQGGTAMFAFLALAGDLGCSGAPDARRIRVRSVWGRSAERNFRSAYFSASASGRAVYGKEGKKGGCISRLLQKIKAFR